MAICKRCSGEALPISNTAGEVDDSSIPRGRRVRIISPVEGWVSVETKEGPVIFFAQSWL